MVAVGIVAPVAGEHFGAATEAEPAVRSVVVRAPPGPGQWLARRDAQGIFDLFLAGGGAVQTRGGGDEEEFDFGDLEGWIPCVRKAWDVGLKHAWSLTHFAMTFSAYRHGRLAAD